MNDEFSPVPQIKQEAETMSFYDALKEATKNKRRMTRLDWNSNDEFGFLAEDGILHIHTRGANHRWILQSTDIEATDWCLLPEQS